MALPNHSTPRDNSYELITQFTLTLLISVRNKSHLLETTFASIADPKILLLAHSLVYSS